MVDLEHRWKRGKGKTVETYLGEFPELRDDPDSLAELLRGELESRLQAGDESVLDDFRSKYPEFEFSQEEIDQLDMTRAHPVVRSEKREPADPLQIGRYLVKEELGRGRFGTVYRAHDPDIDRDVAIKIARESAGSESSAFEAFCHEAKSAARVRHPNIVTVLDFGRAEDGRPFIVFDYVAGKTLLQRIADQDYTLPEAVAWIAALADALHAAHKKGLVHRDVKPGNVLVDEDNVPRLTDFGLARLDDHFFLDDRKAIVGTARYMSPEQANQRADWASSASDIYSLGIVLYELLCKRVPFRSMLLKDLLEEVKSRPPDAPRVYNDQIPPRLEQVCLKALSKKPADRPKTAGDMACQLRAAIKPPSNRLVLIAAGLSLAAIVVVSIFLAQHDTPSPTVPLLIVEDLAIDVKPLDKNQFFPLPERLPHAGDGMQMYVELNRDAHVYLMLYRSNGERQLCWPPDPDSADRGRTRYLSYPEEKDEWLVAPDNRGVMLVMVGARENPLAPEEIGALLQFKPSLPAAVEHAKLPIVVHPRPTQLSNSNVIPRGNPLAVRRDEKFVIPKEVKDLAERTFDAYFAVMFSHFEAEGLETVEQ